MPARRHLTAEQRDRLEALIDGASLAAVVESLAEIAGFKAEHVRDTWQDDATARSWQWAGDRLDKLAAAIVRRIGD